MIISPFLRTILKLDSASCLIMAAGLIPASKLLEPMLGMPTAFLAAAGASLLPVGLFILWLSSRREAAKSLVLLVIAGNVGWVAASLLSLGWLQDRTALGTALLLAQGAAVALFAMLEWRGLRESAWASAA
ncbi:hypothetical protein G7077_03405 [Sphingomonas piscis]|uniref:Uncharacterized protein n=1 Tax=Sphingomonas piscis TaxID=2714943 RepID=A0A6G7YMY6_9SPHN|nr:hypothetical protein [Sphingomonas piscis]QIK78101.1 hypothetical protein G7077_03405 [Sphingomonas piscis]